MPEVSGDKSVYSLAEVVRSIQKTLQTRYSKTFWVKAEMNKLNYYSHSGHCYPELVEKHDGKVIAQMKSMLWKNDYRQINDAFIRVLKEPLKDGVKILLLAEITFDPVYGIALRIHDIDPSYTLGDLEKEKQETIEKIKKEGIFGENKSLRIPLLPQRIAIISVETSKGYADFLKVLEESSPQYKFFHMLFPALLQGEKAIQSIMKQLRNIKNVCAHFDVVAIIRGGGGDVGLACYNNYELSKAIATFPIPVLTGIGHATNETVAEMVSCRNGITPTKVAEDLLQQFRDFDLNIRDAQRVVTDFSHHTMRTENNNLAGEVKLFRHVTRRALSVHRTMVHDAAQHLARQSVQLFRTESEWLGTAKADMRKSAALLLNNLQLEVGQLSTSLGKQALNSLHTHQVDITHAERNVQNMSPEQVLRRGYSITMFQGRSLRGTENIREGDEITTVLHQGELTSTITSTKPTNDHE